MTNWHEREDPPKPDSVWLNDGIDWLERPLPKPSFLVGLLCIVATCVIGVVFFVLANPKYQQTHAIVLGEPREVESERPILERLEAGELDDNLSTIVDKTEQPGIVGALPPRDEWMGKFRTARKHKLETNPLCEACGDTADEAGHLEAHHVISVKRIEEEKLDPSLKLDVNNFIILCRTHHHDCGHPDGWSKSNPNVRRDAAKMFDGYWQGWTYPELVRAKFSPQAKRGETLKRGSTERKTTVSP